MDRSSEIESKTREVYAALEGGDASAVNALWSRQDGTLVIGTDPKEWWPGYDTISKVWEAQLGEIGGIAVENADPDRPTLVLGGEMRIPLRITGVWTRENGEWKLAQWHASIGVANEESFGDELTTDVGDAA